jgi:lipopolysaccharide/colanic/teichoic acid biosynthesis glycosyltransferase
MSSAVLTVQPSGDELTPRRSWYAFVKRPLDAVLALLGLIVSLPILLPAALLVKLTSRGPVLYSQVRLGAGGRPFWIYKLRTMAHNCEAQSGPCWSTKGDPRVTPLGRFLRRTHLDELPQLWNILIGDMSLIGPRPERPEMVRTLEKVLPRYRQRMADRPGLTGLAQVQLPPDTDLNSVRAKLAHDLYYLERSGFWFDIRILLATAAKIMGIPAGVTRSVLALPGGKSVEQQYERAVDEGAAVPELQSA